MLLYASLVMTTLEVSTRDIRIWLLPVTFNEKIEPSLETLQLNPFQLLDVSQRMEKAYSERV